MLRRAKVEEKIGLMYVPDVAKTVGTECEVVAVGPGGMNLAGERVAMGLAVGQRVVLAEWGGVELEDEGGQYVVVEEGDVLCVLEG